MLQAQEKFSLDLFVAPDYTSYYDNHDNNHFGSILKLNQNWKPYRGGMGWRFGVSYSKRLNDDYLLRLGSTLIYSSMANTNEWDYFQNEKIEFWYLDFPFTIRREMEERVLSPFLEAGIAPSIYLGSRRSILHEGQQHFSGHGEEYSELMPKLHLIMILSGGFNYQLNEKFKMFFQPSFRYQLNGIEFSTDYKEHLYGFGLEVGIRKMY